MNVLVNDARTSLLRVRQCSRPDRPSCSPRASARQASPPCRKRRNPGRPGPQAADSAKAATVERLPCAAAHSSARIDAGDSLEVCQNVSVRFSDLCVFLLVTSDFNSPATIINRRGAEFAEPRNLLIYKHLKKSALFLSNSRLRPFVLRVLCVSAVIFVIPWL